MSEMSSVQKILDELHCSRIRLENDKKAAEQAKAEHNEIEQKILQLRDQFKSFDTKLIDVYKATAVRKMEVAQYAKKNEISDHQFKELKAKLDLTLQHLTADQLDYSSIAQTLLDESIEFAQVWSCTERGSANRKVMFQKNMEDVKTRKVELERDLEPYMEMQSQISKYQNILEETELRHKEHEKNMEEKEKELHVELEEVNDQLSLVIMKKQEASKWRNEEIGRLTGKIRSKKETIGKLNFPASTTQKTTEIQKTLPSMWAAANQKLPKNSSTYHPYKSTQQVQINQSALKFGNVNIKENQYPSAEPQWSTENATQAMQKVEPVKATRMFHFKKKIVPQLNPLTDQFISGREFYQQTKKMYQ